MKIKRIVLLFIIGLIFPLIGCTLAEPGTYKVTFYSDGKVVSEKQYKKDDIIELPENPTKEGLFFAGWDINGDGEADEVTKCTNNMNIFAIFKDSEKYTVIFKNGDVELSKSSYAKGAMPTIPSNPEKEGFVFVGWDSNNDDEVDEVKSVTADVTYSAIFRDNNVSYTIEFVVNGEIVKSEEHNLNDTINMPSLTPTKERTAQYSYSFLGWDVNGDGEVETFPYTVKGNHRFIALFNETVNQYTYKLYDGINLIKSETVDYGSKISYTGSLYKKDLLGKYHYLIGWDKDGDDTPDDETVIDNVSYHAIYVDTQIVVMHYESEEIVSYVKEGEEFDLYEPTLPSSRKCVWYLDNGYTEPYNHSVMIKGNLVLYGRSELSYSIDCSVLEMTPKTSVDSEDELIKLFDYLVFTKTYSHTVRLNYDVQSEEFAKLLCDECHIDSAYQLGTSYNSLLKELKLTIQYKNVNTESIKSLYEENEISYYSQYNSLNYRVVEKTRTDDFKLFIDDVDNTFNVNDSEQLYYVLEHGYRPIIDNGNTNLINLYNKMRNVLRDNINDDMSDYDKVLAIYEWIIMNVTYDRVALQLSSNPNITMYHSFFLEGVFDENLAVCDGISKALVCLCNMEGIPAIRVTGTGSQNHAWNKVCINNKWYVVDATSGGTIIGDSFEILTHRFFLITDDDYKDMYTEDGKYYADFKAEGVYDYYDNYKYTYSANEYKYRCESKNDLVRVLSYFKTIEDTHITIDVKLDFEYSGSISDLMSSAMSLAHYNTSLNYSEDHGILLLIK